MKMMKKKMRKNKIRPIVPQQEILRVHIIVVTLIVSSQQMAA